LENLIDDDILKNCDDVTITSLNGSRVADIILREVEPNLENFRTTLRCIKLWAKSRGIYSNVLGYFGGVTWMIMVAIICKMCPYLEPNKLLKNFFLYFSKWDWNYKNPVMLVPVSHERKCGISETLLYKESESDLMPVLTPAYPAMNSTHNVSISTKEAILTEMEKAHMIVEALLKRDYKTGKKINPELSWNRLFKKFNFFGAYQHFIQITVLSVDGDHHKDWEGFVESKIRHFLKNLESLRRIKGTFGLEFRPWPQSYSIASTMVVSSQTEDCKAGVTYTKSSSFFIGIRVKMNQNVQ